MNAFKVLLIGTIILLGANVPTNGQSANSIHEDSSGIRKIEFEYPHKDTIKYIESSLGFLWRSSTDEVEPGIGGILTFDYVRLSPFIGRAEISIAKSKLNFALFENKDFISIRFNFGIMYRFEFDYFKPYLGGGISIFSNTWPSDEYCGDFIIGPYPEEYSCVYKYGSGIAPAFISGIIIKLSDRIGIMADVKYIAARPRLNYTIYQLQDDSYKARRDYNMQTWTFFLGINFGLR